MFGLRIRGVGNTGASIRPESPRVALKGECPKRTGRRARRRRQGQAAPGGRFNHTVVRDDAATAANYCCPSCARVPRTSIPSPRIAGGGDGKKGRVPMTFSSTTAVAMRGTGT